MFRHLLVLVFISGLACGQDSPELAELQRRFEMTATRAIANFESGIAIGAALNARGMVLRSQTTVLRRSIEAKLDQTETAIKRQDLAAAREALRLAEASLDRYARQLGGI